MSRSRALQMPTLTDGLVVLRPWSLDDVALVRLASADARIPSLTTVPRVPDAGAAGAFIRRQQRRSQTGEGYSFAITSGSTGEAVGQAGLWLRDVEQARLTAGYWVAEPFRRRGYASPALTLLATFAAEAHTACRLELLIEPDNIASAATARGAGFQRSRTLADHLEIDGDRRDADLYVLAPRQAA